MSSPSPDLHDLTIGFDIGGTNLRAGVVNSQGEVIATRSVLTPHTDWELSNAVLEVVAQLRAEYPSVGAVGLAVAGFIDTERATVRFAPHLPLRDFPLREHLNQRLDLPVCIEHDANSAAWGEYCFGAAQGADVWVLFAVGTGIGTTLMINGEIFRGAYGTAPEFGHLQVVPRGRECSCGKSGCLERYASGTALADTVRELAARGMKTEDPQLARLDELPEEARGPVVMAAARAGDELGVAAVEDFARWLGLGLSMVTDVLDPSLIVLGGGVSDDADLYLEQAVSTMGASAVGSGHRPLAGVLTAKLGSRAGMIGVADLARQSILSR